jgi:uncharacterized protein (DUF1330 family)
LSDVPFQIVFILPRLDRATSPLDTTLIALLEFPSEDAVKAFASDPKYAPHAAARQRGSESRFQMIDDTDLAGTIPYLRKG